MRLRALCPGVLVLLALRCVAAQTSSDLAIVHVNVVDVRTGSVENDATVVVSGSKIKAILQDKSAKVATGARVVDAHGGYLIPGLWDTHVHSEGDKRVLRLMLASGITGVRDMGGDVYKLIDARRHIEARDWDGPRLLFAGPMLEGPPGQSDNDMWIVHTPEEGQRAVASLAALRVDFIKVHDHLSRDVYFAIASAAKKAGLPFAGHVTASISPLEASDAGQASIEHFEFLPKVCVPLLGDMAVGDKRLPDDCTRASTEALLRHLAGDGTWLDPTLQSFRYFAPLQWKQILAGFEDIANTRRVIAVIARGTLFDRSRLHGLAVGASRAND